MKFGEKEIEVKISCCDIALLIMLKKPNNFVLSSNLQAVTGLKRLTQYSRMMNALPESWKIRFLKR